MILSRSDRSTSHNQTECPKCGVSLPYGVPHSECAAPVGRSGATDHGGPTPHPDGGLTGQGIVLTATRYRSPAIAVTYGLVTMADAEEYVAPPGFGKAEVAARWIKRGWISVPLSSVQRIQWGTFDA